MIPRDNSVKGLANALYDGNVTNTIAKKTQSPCHDCLLEHAAAGDDVVKELAVELSQAKITIDKLTARLASATESKQ
jgi:hypothetical protein